MPDSAFSTGDSSFQNEGSFLPPRIPYSIKGSGLLSDKKVSYMYLNPGLQGPGYVMPSAFNEANSKALAASSSKYFLVALTQSSWVKLESLVSRRKLTSFSKCV